MSDLTTTNTAPEEKSLIVDGHSGQFLTFLVGKEKLAASILDVNEIIEIGTITHVPMTPDYIRGVINLRGNVVPVIDLSARLGHKPSKINKRSCIVMVEVAIDNDSQSIGMQVDQVNEILEITDSCIQPAPEFGSDIRIEFIQGMGRVDDDFIILLDVSRVLSVKELSQLSQVVSSVSNGEQVLSSPS